MNGIAEKIEKVFDYSDCTDCFATAETIIDYLHPETGKTAINAMTLEEVRAERPEYATAERMSIEEYCKRKVMKQRTPIEWHETTEERFNEMLEVLPPILLDGDSFLVGEPFDHDAGNGRPRFSGFIFTANKFYASNRPMTCNEFKEERQKIAAGKATIAA
jgi:hypothetical protein